MGQIVIFPWTVVVASSPEKVNPSYRAYTFFVVAAGRDQLVDYMMVKQQQQTAPSMTTIKCHWNSVLSDESAEYCTVV